MGFDKSSKHVAGRRRGLTDITNAKVEEDKGVTKNLVVSSFRPPPVQVPVHDNIEPKADERGYMMRAVDDIDGRDIGNPLHAAEYAHSMYIHFNKVEKNFRVNPHYMDKQDFINPKMRCILADWLVSPLH